MVNKKFYQALDLLSKEKAIPEDKLLQMMKRGLESAYKKQYGGAENAEVIFEPEKNKITMTALKTVVEDYPEGENRNNYILLSDARSSKKTAQVGDVFKQEIKIGEFGRLAATVTKQIINQEIRDCEKENTYNYFKEKENEAISAIVSNVNDEFITLALEKNVTTNMPMTEAMSGDVFNKGDHISVYVTKVELIPIKKKTKVYVSRKDKNLVRRIFEQYVPEISDGVVEIMGLAREAGDRTKIGVYSLDSKVDAIGACLGRNGIRIEAIKEQLNGEKIDVFNYSDDPKELIANSLKPAQVIGINLDRIKKEAVAVVEGNQLSLAIGKKGQNVRLAVQATGWKIDIKSFEECQQESYNFEEYFEK